MNKQNQKGNPIGFLLFPQFFQGRFLLAFIVILLGFFIQFFLTQIVAGGILLFAASLLLMFRGIDKRFFNKRMLFHSEWETIDEANLNEIPLIYKRIRRWDISLFELSSCLGWLLFGIFGLISFILIMQDNELTVIGIDILILFVPFYLSGMLKIDMKPQLLTKIEKVLMLSSHIKKHYPGYKIQYLLQKAFQEVRKEKIPYDCKVKLSPEKHNEHFLGIYGQCSMNSVGGAYYPYFYFVIVYNEAFNIPKSITQMAPVPQVTIEKSSEKGVNVIVVRQTTTRTSGYTTKDNAILNLWDVCMRLQQQIDNL